MVWAPILCKQIDVRFLKQLMLLHTELVHEFRGFQNANFRGFIVVEHDFEFQEVAEALNLIQMNPSSADEKYGSVLLNPASLAIRECQRFAKRVGFRRWRANIEGLFGPVLIRAAIEDEFARSLGEGAQFQTARLTSEESVVLVNFHRFFNGECCRHRRE